MKNTLVSALFLSTLFFPKIAKSGCIDGKIFDSHDGQTSDSTLVGVIINDGTSGTAYSEKVPVWGWYGYWYVDSGDFDPKPDSGDTVKMSGSLDVNGTPYTTHMRSIFGSQGGLDLILPTAFLDDDDKPIRAHALGSWVVDDTSGVIDTLKAEGWLAKNPDQKIPYINYSLRALNEDSTKVDTSDIYPQIAINLEKQDSLWQQGDSAFIRVYKSIEDTIWETKIGFPLDTLKNGCATLLDLIVFPETTYVNDQTPPSITNVTEWPDTSYMGPYPVDATITDDSGISEAWLKYRIGSTNPDSTAADSIIGNVYYFTIPSMVPPDTVRYQIKAIDGSVNQNIAYWPGPSQDDWWSFYVYSVGVQNQVKKKRGREFMVYPSIGTIFRVLGAESFCVYDIAGRKVIECRKEWDGIDTKGKEVKDGIYFLKVRGSNCVKVIKLR